VDESAENMHTGNWKYAWTPNGVQFKVNKVLERWSIFPAYTVNGFLTWKIFRRNPSSSLDLFDFEQFIEFNVLPHCTPYPGPRSIIIMDSAPIHKVSEVLIYLLLSRITTDNVEYSKSLF
jgi:hypothetical protein